MHDDPTNTEDGTSLSDPPAAPEPSPADLPIATYRLVRTMMVY